MHLSRGSSGSILARLSYLFSLLLLVGILHNNIVNSSPVQRRQDDGIDPDDPDSDNDTPSGDPFSGQVDNYPSLEDARGKCTVAKDKSVFYSKVGKHEEKPQKFADNLPNGVLMREAFPKGYTDKNDQWTGYKKFLERTSQAFAEKTSGVTHVLLPTDSNTDISKSVWTKFEKPALTDANGACSRIIKVDPNDFTKQCVLWDRKGTKDDKIPDCGVENGPIPDPGSSTSGNPSSANYAPGWCGVHVVQHQKSNPSDPTSHYHLDVTIFDAAQKQIGQTLNADAPSGKAVGTTGALPYVLEVTAQNVDADAVLFAYGSQSWGSNDQPHHCNFGSYDSGTRQGDCGFTC